MPQYFMLSNFDTSYLGDTFTNLTHAWLFTPGIVFQTYWKVYLKRTRNDWFICIDVIQIQDLIERHH